QPFVRSKEDLIEVRDALDASGCGDIRLIAKIENRAGIDRLEELIPHCDEIVIARGDLGNAMDLWELPAAQKYISAVCRESGRDFMVVTQMLESMKHRQVPTRAEVSDIFNAVADGASSVMVTGETATGEYPALVIRYLYQTVRRAEAYRDNSR
ncbi:MAG: pyruvate kinase, partial [Eubacterium sp.]|nr:pyruvate kinase [Eubacterium sp.]